jgi:hypothetical protein
MVLTTDEDYFKKELLKNDFPLELEIFSLLQQGPWLMTAQEYYYDEDEKKAGYIDLSSFRMPDIDSNGNFRNPVEPFDLNWNLSIECKKSDKNWIFFPLEDYYIGTSGQSLNFSCLRTTGFGHFNPNEEKAASIYRVSSNNKYEIFETVMKLVKYVSYSRDKTWERIQYLDSSKYSIHFWFPIVVFDGKMLNVFTKNNKIENIVESKHTILKAHFGYQNKIHPFAIDIVHKSFFPELLDMLWKDMKLCEEFITKHKTKVKEHLDKSFLERIDS